MKLNVAYQVYSARENAEKDLLGVLKELQAIGYDGVEFAGFYGNTAETVKGYLAETGLKAVSSHVPFAAIQKDPEGTIAFHKAIGCDFIAIPYLDEETRPGGPAFAKTLREIGCFGKKCLEAGITLLYHNHDFEFNKFSGQYGLDFMYDAISEKYLKTEIDTCWVNVAGEVPADYVRKYAGRCPVVHLKDFKGARKNKDDALFELIGIESEKPQAEETAFCFQPVGYGVQDVPAIIKAGLEGGAEWFVVEQDLSVDRPALEAAKMSCEYIRSIEL